MNPYLDYGTVPNDGTGDTLREAAIKMNRVIDSDPLNLAAIYNLPRDGKSIVTSDIVAGIERAHNENRPIYLPGGDYVVDSELPFYSNVPILGDGKVYNDRVDLSVLEINIVGNEMEIIVDDPNDVHITYRLMSGDPIKIFDSTPENNGIHGITRVEPADDKVVVDAPAGAVNDSNSQLNCELSINKGGSILRMTNLSDGSVYDEDRFFDADDIRNAQMYRIGFIGPGINSEYGGGIRFRRTSSTALTGYNFSEVSLAHVPMDGFRFGQLINSTLVGVNVNRCVGDGMLFRPDPGVGGSNTSLNIIGSYIQNVRRGIAFEILAYSNLAGCVVEGADIGYYVKRGIGVNFNGCGSETIKFNENGSGFGETFRLIDPIAVRINGKAVYYNTNEEAWSKASVVAIDTSRRTESSPGQISSGHVHPSIGPKVPILGTRWSATQSGNEYEGRFYIDVSDDYGYEPPEGSISSSWIGNSYWDDSIQVVSTGVLRDSLFNDRFKVIEDGVSKFPYTKSNAHEEARAPGPNDDANAGFSQFNSTNGLWKDTSVSTDPDHRIGRYVCIDDTPGAARWVDAESLFEVNVNMRNEPFGDGTTKDKEPTGTSEEAYLIRAGRNYGVDIATEYIQRVLETASDGSGNLEAWLDISEWQPVGTFVRIRSEDTQFTGGFVRNKSIENINGIDYLKVGLIRPFANNDVAITDISNIEYQLEVDTHGIFYSVKPSYYSQDQSASNTYFYIPVEEFVDVAETIDVYNTRLDEMEGEWTVDSVSFDTTSYVNVDIPCVKVVCSDRTLRTNITRTVDDAVYNHSKFDNPMGGGYNIQGTDHLFTYDPHNAVAMGQERETKFTIPDTQSEVVVDIPGANNYNYKVQLDNSFQNVRIKSSDYNSVTIERDSSTGEVVGTLSSFRKKSPGWLSVYDRN